MTRDPINMSVPGPRNRNPALGSSTLQGGRLSDVRKMSSIDQFGDARYDLAIYLSRPAPVNLRNPRDLAAIAASSGIGTDFGNVKCFYMLRLPPRMAGGARLGKSLYLVEVVISMFGVVHKHLFHRFGSVFAMYHAMAPHRIGQTVEHIGPAAVDTLEKIERDLHGHFTIIG